jgi:hypothetical protein
MDASSDRFPEPGTRAAENRPTSSPTAILGAANPGRERTGGVSESGGPRAHAAPQHAPSDARDHAAARSVAARSIWSAARDAPRPRRSRDRCIVDHGALPRSRRPASPWCSTPANHNYPADRLPGARVAASCKPPSNLVQNQDDRVFAHYGMKMRLLFPRRIWRGPFEAPRE